MLRAALAWHQNIVQPNDLVKRIMALRMWLNETKMFFPAEIVLVGCRCRSLFTYLSGEMAPTKRNSLPSSDQTKSLLVQPFLGLPLDFSVSVDKNGDLL